MRSEEGRRQQPSRPATSVLQVTRDQEELGPAVSGTGRCPFLLKNNSSG